MDETYTSAWEDLKKRSFVFWVVFLTSYPGAILFGGMISALFNTEYGEVYFIILWGILFTIVGKKYAYWQCPRCKGHFFLKHGDPYQFDPFIKACKNCGLNKWQEN